MFTVLCDTSLFYVGVFSAGLFIFFNFYWSYIFLISGHVFKRKTKQHSNGINKY